MTEPHMTEPTPTSDRKAGIITYRQWQQLKLPADKRRVLSGTTPSGKLHLGNYFGAMKQHLDSQAENAERFFFIADYHSMISLTDANERRARSLDIALDYLALGLDPAKTFFFRQSDVPEVHELAWMLACVTNTGLMDKSHAFKDKVAKGIESSVGLYTYPILMAADILIYRSHWVPVGEDQVQHLEMTRDMAGKFNRMYGDVFPLPQAMLVEAGAKVPGIDGQKMSKSYGNTIDIFAEGKALKKAVMGIVTDSKQLEDSKDPETSTIFELYSLLATEDETTELAAKYRAGGMGYGAAKTMLLEKIEQQFGPAREKRKDLEKNRDYVEQVLRDGAIKARAEAAATMKLARSAAGF
jgi:tryptophanyl-tRNA synthetase